MMNSKLRFALILLWVIVSFPCIAQVAGHESGEVLVISSFSPKKENGNNMITSFSKYLQTQTGGKVAINYMDGETFLDTNHWEAWQASLFPAYGIPPGMVVILGNEAWAAYRKSCPENWKKIPVVLGGVKQKTGDFRVGGRQDSLSLEDMPLIASTFDGFRVTGYYISDYLEENLRLIRQLRPEVKNIAFCYDNPYHYTFFKDYFRQKADQIGGIKLHYWLGDQLSTLALADSIIGMNQTFAAVCADWYVDANRYPHAYSMLWNKLSVYPDKYMFQLSDQDFANPNYVGGYFVSGEEIGKDLGKLAFSVLTKGLDASPSFRETPSAPRYHLNYEVFKEAGLDEDLLPDGVVWYNARMDFFQEHSRILFLGGGLALMGLILAFLIRRHRIYDYKKSNREMKQLLEAMPDMAVVFNAEEKVVDIINPMPDLLLDFPKEEVIGHNMTELSEMLPGFREIGRNIGEYIRLTLQTKEVHSFNYDVMLKGHICYAEIKTVPFEKDKVICFVHNITSRVFIEKELTKYKNFLSSIIDTLPVGVLVKDVADDFRYIYYNRKAGDFGSIPSENYLGKNDFEVGDPDALCSREEDEYVLRSEAPVSYERIIGTEPGKQQHAVVTKIRLISDDGSRHIVTILMDITDIRKNETELENIRHELSVALDAGSLSAWIYDVEKCFFTSLYREALVRQGSDFDMTNQMIHPEDRARYRSMMNDLVAGKCEKRKEILRVDKNGEYGWYEIHAIAIRSAEGQVRQVVGTEKNITEEILRQREIEASKFKMELVISSNGIVQWDYDVVNRHFSSPNRDSFMYEGMSMEKFLSAVYPEDVPVMEEALDRLVRFENESLNIQIRIWLPEKGFRWTDIHAVAFQKDERGNVTQITGLRSDVTEWKNLTDELILLRDKAEEANRLKTAFLANMSHEIRTPLNAIVGFSNLIAQAEDPGEVKEFCNIIETNNELLLQLVNDILDLSKIEAGQLDFVYTDIHVSSIFENLEQIYRFRIKEGVRLICDLPEEDCVIHSEKNRLTQVLSNFLSNACKFTFEGCIRMGYGRVPGGLRFFVSDTGKGIAQENLPYVFERFMKFDSFIQGTGLGLSICQTIVNNLNGQIGVESEIGQGCTFWFTIPCEIGQAQPETDTEEKLLAEDKTAQKHDRKKHILIAEDNDSNYLLLQSMLKKDYLLSRAEDGDEAVRLCAELHPDLILMDVRMPVMDGLQATETIRRTDSGIPIIALTANAFDEDRERARKAGCNDYLSKPVDQKRLGTLLAKFL